MNRFKWLLFGSVLFLLFPLHVGAHSYVTDSTPADGEELAEAVTEIMLHFNAGIERVSTATVYFEDGEEVSVEDITVESPDLTISLNEPLAPGDYTVDWRALGEDTHQTEGTIAFRILDYEEHGEIEEDSINEETTVVDEIEEPASEDETTTGGTDEVVEAENVVESSMERFLLPIVMTGAIALLFLLLYVIKRVRK
ncbi:copper resistance protein CopC [Alkalihalobacillus sp. MEB130]|uniref:copper resistance CopC family protein n=1 Tax=Alkalihalobacillus sp. MEB130 TaxID=2976704 RepID=UPI0028DFA7FE|nr:copper resistance protein CopC [Alkalihalobacillus sp. MEB130]MDT8860573.1 copper resistance protein CopC [Alkalihalobacillus sp. MEB130]